MLRGRKFAILAVVSLAFSIAMVAIWISTYDLKPHTARAIHFSSNAMLPNRELSMLVCQGQASIYNGEFADPGNVLWFVESPTKRTQYNFAGIYFITYTPPARSGNEQWTIDIPFLYLTAVGLILPFVWLITHDQLRSKDPQERAFEPIMN